jgi:hypothetical protein
MSSDNLLISPEKKPTAPPSRYMPFCNLNTKGEHNQEGQQPLMGTWAIYTLKKKLVLIIQATYTYKHSRNEQFVFTSIA